MIASVGRLLNTQRQIKHLRGNIVTAKYEKATKFSSRLNIEPPLVPTESYFDSIEATMMGATNSKLRFLVLKNDKEEEKQIVTLPTLSLIQFCLNTLVQMKAMRTELENAFNNEKDSFFKALEITDRIPVEEEMALPSIKKIGHFVGKLSKPKKLSIIDCDD